METEMFLRMFWLRCNNMQHGMRLIKYVALVLSCCVIVWSLLNLGLTGQTDDGGTEREVGARSWHKSTATPPASNALLPSRTVGDGRGHRPDNDRTGRRPLLCLFTTFRDDKPLASRIYRRVLSNWNSLAPRIKPYLFVDRRDDRWAYVAETSGWRTLTVDRYRQGVPVFGSMLRTFDKTVNSTFIGYSHDDVLFDLSLVETLEYIQRAVRRIDHRDVLLVGRRYDYTVTDGSVADLTTIMASTSKKTLAGPEAIDYVIISRLNSKWNNMPDMVVGASDLINLLLTMALEWNYIVIEVTSTLKAVRLAAPKLQVHSSAKQIVPAGTMNSVLFDKRTYEAIRRKGETTCVSYFTICRRWPSERLRGNKRCNFALAKRVFLSKYCTNQANASVFAQEKKKSQKGVNAAEPDEYDTFEGEMFLL